VRQGIGYCEYILLLCRKRKDQEGRQIVKVLLTGGAGFIGSHVADLYLANGYDVVIVDNLSTGHLANVNPAAKFYEMDIRSAALEDVFARERPDIVNHHAAQMDVRRSVAEPLYDSDVNIRGSINVLECARKYGVQHFIYISSGGAVYGEPVYLPCDENHPIMPLCPYGASKHSVEHYLYMYAVNFGLKYTIIRYPNVYGPRQDPGGEAGVVAIFIGRMLSGQQTVINGDGDQERDYVYVGDCAQANLLALSTTKGNEIYNLGSGHGTSVNAIFDRLKSVTRYQGDAIHGPAKVGETRRIYLDARKAHVELGWQPTVALETGLNQTVKYFRMGAQVA
jgi:UDP-glucose 4-epimerase